MAKVVSSISIEEELLELSAAVAEALQITKSQLQEDALKYYLQHGIDKNLRQEFEEKLKNMRSIRTAIRQGRYKHYGGGRLLGSIDARDLQESKKGGK